jgi:hypothetical protein
MLALVTTAMIAMGWVGGMEHIELNCAHGSGKDSPVRIAEAPVAIVEILRPV